MASETLRSADRDSVLARNAGTVYRLAYLRTGNVHDTEDIMQDVFLRYIRRSPEFESTEHEKAWFIRVTVNRTRSFFASPWKQRVVFSEEKNFTSEPVAATGITEAVAALPKDISTAIHLYYYENLPVKDISEATGKSESAVKALLFRGRKLLKLELESETEKG